MTRIPKSGGLRHVTDDRRHAAHTRKRPSSPRDPALRRVVAANTGRRLSSRCIAAPAADAYCGTVWSVPARSLPRRFQAVYQSVLRVLPASQSRCRHRHACRDRGRSGVSGDACRATTISRYWDPCAPVATSLIMDNRGTGQSARSIARQLQSAQRWTAESGRRLRPIARRARGVVTQRHICR
jgi:hypothetical protein